MRVCEAVRVTVGLKVKLGVRVEEGQEKFVTETLSKLEVLVWVTSWLATARPT